MSSFTKISPPPPIFTLRARLQARRTCIPPRRYHTKRPNPESHNPRAPNCSTDVIGAGLSTLQAVITPGNVRTVPQCSGARVARHSADPILQVNCSHGISCKTGRPVGAVLRSSATVLRATAPVLHLLVLCATDGNKSLQSCNRINEAPPQFPSLYPKNLSCKRQPLYTLWTSSII